MGPRSQGARLHHRRPRLRDFDRAATNLLLKWDHQFEHARRHRVSALADDRRSIFSCVRVLRLYLP
jgi:hypothetical protein